MSHIPLAITAYFLNGIAVLVDKALLTKHVTNPLTLVFYFSAFSAVALVFAPFLPVPTFYVFLLASTSTILWTTGAYFYFLATKIGQPSRVIPVIGSLIPILLIIYYGFINKSLTQTEILAALVLVVGMVCLFLPSIHGNWSKKELLFEVVSALFFAISYIILKETYVAAGNFLMVLIWSRTILIPVGLLILILPFLRKKVFSLDAPPINFRSRVGVMFLGGQAAGGISELLLTYSISLANPALVNSLQGTQYAFLFLANIFLSKKYPDIFEEKLDKLNILSKVVGIGLIALGLYLLA